MYVKLILVTLLLFFSTFLYQAVNWSNLHFSGLSFGQIIFHLKVPLAGTDQAIILTFLINVLLPAISLSVIFVILRLIYHKQKNRVYLNVEFLKDKEQHKKIKLNFFPGIISFVPVILISFVVLGFTVTNANRYFNFFGYVSAQLSQSNFIEDHYVDPEGTLTFPEEKRNLIYIYLESVESTFGSREDGGAFKENYIPELTEIARENMMFSDKEKLLGGNPPTVGTSWTMAAMFSHSSGLPLKLPIQGNSMSEFSEFFPGVTTIGEILQDVGYKNYLMIGSDATFGGRRNFYEQHGDYEILDYHRALEDQIIPEGYQVWWGFEDQKLFAWAKDELTEIAKKEEPFNFTMLTVDTHHEDGYLCELCQDDFENQYANVLACSSRQVDEFIKWIQAQDFYENTTIVMVGDHPTMDSDFKDDMDEAYMTTNYNVFINSVIEVPKEKLRHRNFYSFDFFPTTLASLGVKIEGDRLALGTNLFSEQKTLFEEYGVDMREMLQQKSRFYDKKFLFNQN